MESSSKSKAPGSAPQKGDLVKRLVGAGLLAFCLVAGQVSWTAAEARNSLWQKIFGPTPVGPPEYPHAPPAPKDNLVPPPSMNQYFFTRTDGQPYYLNIDSTANMTDAINRFYFNIGMEGEQWAPADFNSTLERSSRLMATWQDYDQMNWWHQLNGVSRFLERASGFGP